MAVITKIDRLITLSAREEGGVVTELIRQAVVTGLSDGDLGVLGTALGVLDTEGYTVGSVPADYGNLVLAGREPSIVPGDPTTVEFRLSYLHFANYEFQTLGSASSPVMLVESSVEQVTSSKKYPFSIDEDLQDILIEVSHAYPADDENHPGKTIIQTGEITITVGRKRGILWGVWATDNPAKIQRFFLNVPNAGAWIGDAEATWLCVKADYMPFDRTSDPMKFRFHFEFEHREETWYPIAQFVDPETGRPPADLVKDTGWVELKTVYPALTDYSGLGDVRPYTLGIE